MIFLRFSAKPLIFLLWLLIVSSFLGFFPRSSHIYFSMLLFSDASKLMYNFSFWDFFPLIGNIQLNHKSEGLANITWFKFSLKNCHYLLLPPSLQVTSLAILIFCGGLFSQRTWKMKYLLLFFMYIFIWDFLLLYPLYANATLLKFKLSSSINL